MDKFIQSDIRDQLVKKGIWLPGLNSLLAIVLVSLVSSILAVIAIISYCFGSCPLI